jgi:hypothetical protein
VLEADDQLTMIGVNRVEYNVEAFNYDNSTFVATWTFDTPISADRVLLELSDAVIDRVGNRLDGNWQSGQDVFPSGNGISESDDRFTFPINMLPGDTDGDGVVNRRDLVDTIFHMGTSIDTPNFDPYFDVDANGRVDTDDLREILFRLSTELPADDPADTGGGTSTVASDTVFSRLGAGSPVAATANVTYRDDASHSTQETSRRTRRSPQTTSGADDTSLSRRRTASRRVSPQGVDVALGAEDASDDDSLFSTRRTRRASRRR